MLLFTLWSSTRSTSSRCDRPASTDKCHNLHAYQTFKFAFWMELQCVNTLLEQSASKLFQCINTLNHCSGQSAATSEIEKHCGSRVRFMQSVLEQVPRLIPLPLTGFLPICQNQIQGLFKDFQGPYEGYIRRTKLNQTGTFISIYKRRKLTQRGPGWSPGRKWILCTFERSHLEHLFQYQLVRTRHFRKSNSRTFKDLQTQIQGLSRTMSVFNYFPGLKNLEKIQGLSMTFKDPQEPCKCFQRAQSC